MFSLLQANNLNTFIVLGKLFDPPMEKAQDRVFGVDDLGDDEKFHSLYNQSFARLVVARLFCIRAKV